MKKVLPALVIAGFLFMPALSLADTDTIIESCTLKHQIGKSDQLIEGSYFSEGVTVTTDNSVADCVSGNVQSGTCYTKATPLICTLDLIITIGDWIFALVLALAVIFVLMGAIGFLTAAGSPEKVKAAQQKIIFAAVGIAVAFLAEAVIQVIKMIVT